MIDNLLGGGDDEDSGESSANSDMDGGLFDESEGDDDLMGGGDDLMGDGDDLMGDGDDGMSFDDMDDGGSTSAEMENRIDELENEVASLSSTVNTVKSENELISESVDEVEENIRKLLEVYEMVTRGVNPFVDESEMGDAFGSGGGDAGGGGNSMGLFGDDEASGSEESEVDESISEASADEFFDDDLDDDFDDDDEFGDFDDDLDSDEEELDDDDGFDDFDDDGFDDDDGIDDGFDDFGDDDFDDGDDGETDSGGKSFEELKAEYDSGEADWDEESAADDSDGGDDESESDIEEGLNGDDEILETSESDDSESDLEEPLAEGEGIASIDGDTDEGGTPSETSESGSASDPVSGDKPYLETLPSGYVADIVVMDWLEFLVEEAGVDGAARTIAYYEAIEWVGGSAADSLQTFLEGFGGGTDADPEPRSTLTISHHNTSLRFISRIVNPDLELVSRGNEAVPRWGPENRTASPNRQNGVSGPNGRVSSTRYPGAHDEGDPRGRYGIEPDGGREPAEGDAFDWGDDRTE